MKTDIKTFADDLHHFVNGYVDEIVLKVLNKAETIYANETLVNMLHEARIRAEQDESEFGSKFVGDVVIALTNPPHAVTWLNDVDSVNINRHSCLRHANSYHQVCRDMIWDIIGEED